MAGGASAETDLVAARLLTGWATETGSHMAAAEFRLAPEWKTYWRAPGDAGIPPQFDWSGSENVKAVRLHWPRPTVFDFNGMRTIGYRDQLILPIEVFALDPALPVVLRAQVDLGVCRDICVPASVSLGGDLAGSGAPDGAIRAALKARPETSQAAGVTGTTCTVEPIRDGLRVTARIGLPALGADEVVVIEPGGPVPVWVSEASVVRTGGHLQAVAEIVPDQPGFALDRSSMTITVISSDRAVEIRGCPAP